MKRTPQRMDIPGTEYYVTIDGDVYRRWKTVPDKKIKPYIKNHSRHQRVIHLCVNGVQKAVTMAYIMKQTYFRGMPEGMCLHHLDGSHENYAVWNLKPCTVQELGRLHSRKHNARCVLKRDAATGEVLEIYPSARRAARENYMSFQTVLDACNNRRKKRPGIASDGYRYEWED